MKLTTDILDKFYDPPQATENFAARFVFMPRVKSLLLPELEIELVAYSRVFQARRRNGSWEWTQGTEEVAALRARLSPEQVASCVRVAIEDADDIPF